MKHKRIMFLIASMTLVAGGILACLFIVTQTEKQAAELRVLMSEAESFKASQEERLALTRVVETTQEERALLEQYVLSEQRTIDFLAEVESIAQTKNIEIETQSLTPVKTEKDTIFDELTVTFQINGTETQLINMIDILETMPYDAQVTNVAMSANQNAGRVSSWRGDVTMRVTMYEYDE